MPNILIVEDNEMNRDMLSRRLKRKGYDISIAVDGQEGLDMMRADRPDLVLMDMGLPVMDGWTATSTAKADDDLKSIPIIALTAHALEQDRIKAMDAGADDFDTKPVNLNRLLEKLPHCYNQEHSALRLMHNLRRCLPKIYMYSCCASTMTLSSGSALSCSEPGQKITSPAAPARAMPRADSLRLKQICCSCAKSMVSVTVI